jgi:hypothetical protein
MREIKFRGKSKDGKWHYGYFWVAPIKIHFIRERVTDMLNADFEVDPESVGQYIDQKDKDKKEIYEGDIIKRLFGPRRYVVEWNQRTTEFLLRDCYGGWTGVNSGCEVIGNITDNPELLVGD